MNQLQLFLPCAAGVEDYLAPEVQRITGLPASQVLKQRGGVALRSSWRDAMLLNLHSRLAQRVLVLLSFTEYRNEQICTAPPVRWRGRRGSRRVRASRLR